jgi:hypothetical protein
MTAKMPFLARFARAPIAQDAISQLDARETVLDSAVASRETPRPRPTTITAVGGETTDDN